MTKTFRIPWGGAVRLYTRTEYEQCNLLYRGCLASSLLERLGSPDPPRDLHDIELAQLTIADFDRATVMYGKVRPDGHPMKPAPAWPADVPVPLRRVGAY